MIGGIDMIFKIKKNYNKNGFTLVEMLLSIAILSVSVILFGSVYVYFTNVQTRAMNSQETLNNANFVLEMMSRELRNAVIYDYDVSVQDCNDYVGAEYDNCILFKRPNGQLATFASRNPDIPNSIYPDLLYIILDCGPVYSTSSCSWSTTNYDAYTDLFLTNFNEIQVEDLNFYITPNTDPEVDELTNQQPRITINMLINFYGGRSVGQISQLLQTTVSTRVFSR